MRQHFDHAFTNYVVFPSSRRPDFYKTSACGKCHRAINLSSAWQVLSALA